MMIWTFSGLTICNSSISNINVAINDKIMATNCNPANPTRKRITPLVKEISNSLEGSGLFSSSLLIEKISYICFPPSLFYYTV